MLNSETSVLPSFPDIRFEVRPGHTAAWLGRYLPGGYWGDKEMFEVAWFQASESVDMLEPDKCYSSKDLCNQDLWKILRGGEPYLLGRCVKFFVTHGMLPLIEANPGRMGKRRYILDLEALARWRAKRGLVMVA
jgi:hypothetical protein